MGHNLFSDLTGEEFESMYLMKGRESYIDDDEEREVPPEVSEEQMREAKDWAASGAVAPVRQQKCGDCYTFSAISALESAYF
jgi:C1A family cysteine protease